MFTPLLWTWLTHTVRTYIEFLMNLFQHNLRIYTQNNAGWMWTHVCKTASISQMTHCTVNMSCQYTCSGQWAVHRRSSLGSLWTQFWLDGWPSCRQVAKVSLSLWQPLELQFLGGLQASHYTHNRNNMEMIWLYICTFSTTKYSHVYLVKTKFMTV